MCPSRNTNSIFLQIAFSIKKAMTKFRNNYWSHYVTSGILAPFLKKSTKNVDSTYAWETIYRTPASLSSAPSTFIVQKYL